MATAYITHTDCLKHQISSVHPESPERLSSIEEHLITEGLMDLLIVSESPKATFEQLARVHSKEHIAFIFEHSLDHGQYTIDPDTAMNQYTLQASLRAAGAVVKATDLVINNQVNNAFCNVRPPGHHAEYEKAMGFCFFNNIATGVAHALEQFGLKRVAIIDFDVHHGNGTENIFFNDNRVLICSSYQSPLYPYTGHDSISGHIINVKLPADSAGSIFRKEIKQQWLPELEAFQPEMIFISAGFDAHLNDPLAQLKLVEDDFFWVTKKLVEIAAKYSSNRIVSSLEGGYHLTALGQSAAAHIKGLMTCCDTS
ncbi:MAG: histone deacetylase family protein [Methylococcaceae bacterium]